MRELKDHTQTKWIIAYSNDLDVFHFQRVDVGQTCSTGQPNFEIFDTETKWIDRINELKGEGYYESQDEI